MVAVGGFFMAWFGVASAIMVAGYCVAQIVKDIPSKKETHR